MTEEKDRKPQSAPAFLCPVIPKLPEAQPQKQGMGREAGKTGYKVGKLACFPERIWPKRSRFSDKDVPHYWWRVKHPVRSPGRGVVWGTP